MGVFPELQLSLSSSDPLVSFLHPLSNSLFHNFPFCLLHYFVFCIFCSLMPENISQACELFFQPPPSSLIGDACVCWVDKAGLSDHGLKVSSYMASSLILEVITYSWWEPAMMWYLQPKELHKLVWGQRRRTEIELHHSLTFAYHHFLRKVLRRQRISLVLYAQAQMRLHQKIGANSSHWVRTQITTYSSVPSSL